MSRPIYGVWIAALNLLKRSIAFYVTIKSASDFVLPSSLFRGTSLESLTLTFSNGIGFLKIPLSISSTTGFSCLKYLKLKAVLLDESFGDWFSPYFKSLEELSLLMISGLKSITINCSSLKTLDISFPFDLVRLRVSAEKLATDDISLDVQFPKQQRTTTFYSES